MTTDLTYKNHLFKSKNPSQPTVAVWYDPKRLKVTVEN